jgi:transposase InsO family protein
MNISVKTFRRWKKDGKDTADRCHGPNSPSNKLTQEEREEIISIVNSDEYIDRTPQAIVPLLADKGRYIASTSTFYRVMRQENLLAHRGDTRPSQKRSVKELMATAPNEIWSWDITYLNTTIKGKYYYLYLIMDVFSRYIVGAEVHEVESSIHASALITRSCQEQKIQRKQITLHSDNGSPMKGFTMLATLEKLGVAASFSRPSISNDNAYSESLFRTLKHNSLSTYKPFNGLDEAQAWVNSFVQWYNFTHLHSGIKYVTPYCRHIGEDIELLKKRDIVFKEAKLMHPERWGSKETRNWTRENIVFLNKKGKEKSLKLLPEYENPNDQIEYKNAS